jgi:Holliday junction resolvasome RuvABC endonuclease subunit
MSLLLDLKWIFKLVLALDISTSITGYCVFNEWNCVEIGHIDLRKEKDFFKKIDLVKEKIKELQKQYDFKAVAIEEAFQSFGRGLSSAKTLFTLAKFNGIIQYIVFSLGISSTVINVNNARKLVGIKINKKDKTKNTKEKVLEQVQQLNSALTWPKRILKSGPRKGLEIYDDCCFDRADAWVIGKAYLIENK